MIIDVLYFHLCFVFGEPKNGNNDEQVTRPRQRGVGSEKNILFRFVCTRPPVLLCTLLDLKDYFVGFKKNILFRFKLDLLCYFALCQGR